MARLNKQQMEIKLLYIVGINHYYEKVQKLRLQITVLNCIVTIILGVSTKELLLQARLKFTDAFIRWIQTVVCMLNRGKSIGIRILPKSVLYQL